MNTPGEQLVLQGHSVIRIENEQQQAIALVKPRNEDKITALVVKEMEAMPEVAKKMFYSIEYERKKGGGAATIVEGVSIHGAMAIQRRWGNCASNARVIEDRANEVICEGVFMDYETNNRVMRQVSVSRLYRPKGSNSMAPVKRLDVAIAAGMSKAVRNAVLNGIPEIVKLVVLQEAKRISKCKREGGKLVVVPLAVRMNELIAKYQEKGVTADKLKKKLGGKTGANEADYDHLLGLYNAINEEQLTVEEAFEEPPAAAEPKQQTPPVTLDGALGLGGRP